MMRPPRVGCGCQSRFDNAVYTHSIGKKRAPDKNLGSRRLQRAAARNPVKVTVASPARLHLGFFDLDGGLGRRFGSIGVAISDLQTHIAIERTPATEITGPESDRVERYLDT